MRKLYFLFFATLIYYFLALNTAYAKDASVLYSDEPYNSYYYNQLSDGAKEIYDGLYSNIEKTKYGTSEIKITISNAQINLSEVSTVLQSAMDAFDRDHPEVFWIDINKIEFKYSIKTIDGNQYVNNVYIVPRDGEDNYLIDSYSDYNDVMIDAGSMNTIIAGQMTYINTFSGNNAVYDKIKYIHDYLISVNDYNKTQSPSPKASKSVSAICGNIDTADAPMCEGYARAFKVLCDNAAIPCVIVSGKAGADGKTLQPHMWNYVYLEDNWYAIDVTWDDPVVLNGTYEELGDDVKYKYFLLGAYNFNNTHFAENIFVVREDYDFGFEYPYLSGDDYINLENTYKIIIDNPEGGSITTNIANHESVIPGTVVRLTITPDEGMQYVNGSLVINDNKYFAYSFVMPENDVFISCEFTPIDEPDNNDNPDVVQEETESPGSTSPPESGTAKPTSKPADAGNTSSPATVSGDNQKNTDKNTDKNNNKNNNIIVISSDDEFKETISEFDNSDDEYAVKINNFSSLNLSGKKILAGVVSGGFGHDVNLSIYNTIYDVNDIKNIIQSCSFDIGSYSEAVAFSIKILNSQNGKIEEFNEGDAISFLIPLDENYYDADRGVLFYEIESAKLQLLDYNIVSFDGSNYIYFRTSVPTASYVIIYCGDNIVEIENTQYTTPKSGENADVMETQKNTETGQHISFTMKAVIILMVIIVILSMIFILYMFYLNKMNK